LPIISSVDLRTIELKISRGENLPVLPQVIGAVVKAADDPRTTARDLEKLIEQDAALTAKVLRVVNSPTYGVGHLTSVGRALAVIGVNRVKGLLISVAFQNMLSDRTEVSSFNKLEYWRHSLAVANAAKLLGRLKMPYRAEEFFCAGLLHDIGLIVMDKFSPESLDRAIRVANSQNMTVYEAEVKVLEYNHAQLGGFLAAKWGFGESIKTMIEHHHDRSCLKTPNDPAAFIMVADMIAHEAGFTNQLTAPLYRLNEEILAAVDISMEMVGPIKDSVVEELVKAEQLFNLTNIPGMRRRPPARVA